MPPAALAPEQLARLLAPPDDGESLFRAIFEHTSAGISLTDADGRFVACNPAFAATIGRTVEQVIGLTPADVTHPDDWADQRHQFEAARAGGAAQYTVAKRYVRPDGTPVWTELSFAAIHSACGQYKYGLGVTVDVSDRKRAEDTARRAAELFRLVWEGSADGMRLTDADGLVKAVNPAYCRLIGRAAGELVGRPMTAAFAAHEQAGVLAKYVRRFAAREARRMGLSEVTLWDGRRRWFEVGDAYLDLPGQPTHLLTVFRDATDRRQAEDRLREGEERFRAAMEGSLDAVFFLTAERDDRGTITDFRFTDLNGRGAALVSRRREEVIGQRLCELLPVNRTAGFFDKYARVVETGEPLEEEFPIAADGIAASWLHHQVVRVGDGVVITSQDVTARKRAEIGLRASEEQIRTLGDNLPDGVVYQYVIGADGRDHFPYMSRGIERLTGLQPAQVRADARLMFGLVQPDDMPPLMAAVVRSMSDLTEFDLETRYRHLNGNLRWMHIRAAPRRLADGGTLWDGVMIDVTDRKRAEEELRRNEQRLIDSQRELERANARLRRLAATDGLTGVNNRAAFDARLGEEYDRAVRYDHPLSVVMLDVDHFKPFNDTFGHPAGDGVLRAVADHLGGTVRGTDFLARYGGEEFAVVLPDTDHAGAMVLAERLRQAVAGGRWEKRPVTVSVGVATLGPHTPDADALVQEADRALYASKLAGRNRVHHGGTPIPTVAVVRGLPVV